MRSHHWLVLLLLIVTAAVKAQKPYYPEKDWQRKTPAELKMNTALIDSAVRFATNNESKTDVDLRIALLKAYANEPGFTIAGPTRSRGKAAGLIIKNGFIVAEWGDINRVDMTFSVTKSYLSSIAGLAIDAQLIGNVNEPAGKYLWDETYAGNHNAKITWKHLLTQSSDWSGCLFGVCDWADRPPRTGTIDDWKNRKLLEPGEAFEYNDVRVNLLAYSLLQVWRKPLPAVLKEKIMDPIGASTTWRWYGYDNSYVPVDGVMVQSVSGGGHFGGGLFINTLDQARYGLLFLRNGRWKEQQLISSQWVEESHQPSAANPSYGYLWWTNKGGNLKGLSDKLFYADGFGGNYIVVDREHDLLVVLRWMDSSKLSDLLQIITAAVSK